MSWAEVKKINSDMTMSLDELFKKSFVLTASEVMFERLQKKGAYSNLPHNAHGTSLNSVAYKDCLNLKLKMNSGNTANLTILGNITLVAGTNETLAGTCTIYAGFKLEMRKNGVVVHEATYSGDTPTLKIARSAGSTDSVNLLISTSTLINFKEGDEIECVVMGKLKASDISGGYEDYLYNDVTSSITTNVLATPYVYPHSIDVIEEI